MARQVIHNPGTIPDAGFTDTNTDITVVFEGSYQEYQEQEAALTSLPPGRLQYSYLSQDYYESFGPDWQGFIEAMPGSAG
jgi:hypothetical protein